MSVICSSRRSGVWQSVMQHSSGKESGPAWNCHQPMVLKKKSVRRTALLTAPPRPMATRRSLLQMNRGTRHIYRRTRFIRKLLLSRPLGMGLSFSWSVRPPQQQLGEIVDIHSPWKISLTDLQSYLEGHSSHVAIKAPVSGFVVVLYHHPPSQKFNLSHTLVY